MRKVIPKNIADEMTRPYIDDAVDKQLKAADVPPRNKLDISFKDAGRTDDNKDYESNQEAYEKNHGKLYDMTHNNTIPWKNYVVYIVLLSLLTCVFTFSKYMSGINGASDAVVAKFNVQVDANIDGNIVIKPISDPNANNIIRFESENDPDKTVSFLIKNYSDVAITLSMNKNKDLSTSPCSVSVSLDKNSLGFYSGTGEPPSAIATVTISPPTEASLDEDEVPDETGCVSAGKLVFDLLVSQVE